MKKMLMFLFSAFILFFTLQSKDQEYTITRGSSESIGDADIIGENENDTSTKDHPGTIDYNEFEEETYQQVHFRKNDGVKYYTNHSYKDYSLSGTIDYPGDVDYYKISIPTSKLLKFVHTPKYDIRLLDSLFRPVSFSYDIEKKDENGKNISIEDIFGLLSNQEHLSNVEYILEVKHHDKTIRSANYNILITDLIYEPEIALNYDDSQIIHKDELAYKPKNKMISYKFEDNHWKHHDTGESVTTGIVEDFYFDDYRSAINFARDLQVTMLATIQNLFRMDGSRHTSIIDQVHYFARENNDGKVHIRIYTYNNYEHDEDGHLYKQGSRTDIEITKWDGVIIDYPIYSDWLRNDHFEYTDHTMLPYE
ncbi:hypothetical protein KHQ81_15000 [Mycoplasmatota bacterium]|nr:hypothetical protein KHQ81_15000 [Mycoplasmatota bacterium]